MIRRNVGVFSVMVVVFVMCCFISNSSPLTVYGAGKPCRLPGLANGIVIPRSRGRFIKYRCMGGFKILGDRTATCLRGAWEFQNQSPVCVRSGCSRIPWPANGQTQDVVGFMGSVVTFSCDPGFTLTGSPAAFCNGFRWNATVPVCTPELTATSTECDFEDADLCGWRHAADHQFEWTRYSGPTPSHEVQTGPSWDHTKGKGGAGHYMYTESSSPRQENDTARLVSPVFASALSDQACVVFYCHMFGRTIGTLNLYVKPEGQSQRQKIFTLSGQQGNKWVRTVARIEPLDENFQLVFEGVQGSTYLSDMAIDDVRLVNGTDCESEATTTEAATDAGTTFDADVSQSCRGRCFEPPPQQGDDATVEGQFDTNETLALAVCQCNLACTSTSACCGDFEDYCITSKTSPTTASTTASHQTIATIHYSPPSVTVLPPPWPPLPPKPTPPTTELPSTPLASSTSTTSSLSSSLSSPTSMATPTSSPTFAPASLTSTSPTSSTQPPEEPTTASTKPTLPATPTPSTTNPPTTKTTAKTNPPTTLTVSATSPKSSFSPRTSTASFSAVPKRTTLSLATSTLATSATKPPTKKTPLTTKPTTLPSTRTSKTTKVSAVSVTTPLPTVRPSTTSTRKSISPFWASVTTATPTRQIAPSKASVKSNDKQNSVDIKEQIDRESKFLENSQLLKEKPTNDKDNTWQVAHRVADSRSVSKLALYSALAAGTCVLLAVAAGTSVLLVRRRRAMRRGNLDDESEVRFLTADEILDFNIAQPKDDDL